MNRVKIARDLLKVAKSLTAESGIDRIAKHFDYLEGRWQDEHMGEDFADYAKSAMKKVNKEGFRFVQLEEDPMKLVFMDKTLTYEMYISGNQIKVDSKEK